MSRKIEVVITADTRQLRFELARAELAILQRVPFSLRSWLRKRALKREIVTLR